MKRSYRSIAIAAASFLSLFMLKPTFDLFGASLPTSFLYAPMFFLQILAEISNSVFSEGIPIEIFYVCIIYIAWVLIFSTVFILAMSFVARRASSPNASSDPSP